MGLASLIEYEAMGSSLKPAAPAFTVGEEPTRRQLFYSRLNRGVNIGSWFVLEKWITPSLFPEDGDSTRTSELDAVQLAMERTDNDTEVVKEQFEQHWRSWMEYDDWSWLKEVGVTAVRVPVGYWVVDNGEYCDDGPFENYKDVYENAWDIFKEVVIERAAEHDIGIIVDMQGLPGASDTDDHSGAGFGRFELWGGKKHKAMAINALEFIAEDLRDYDNVVGIQVISEANFEEPDEEEQNEFYFKAIHAIRDQNEDIPIIIPDGGDSQRWIDTIKDAENQLSQDEGELVSLGVIIDTHFYKCYADHDRSRTPRELIDEAENSVPDTRFAVDIMVGEYSCVLDSQSWEVHDDGDGELDDLIREFGTRECATFNAKSCGFYFWTYKFEHGGSGDWCFREMMEKGALNTAFGAADDRFPGDREPDAEYYETELENRFTSARDEHVNYWDNEDGDRDWEHWRFEVGYKQGWEDAYLFDRFYHSELGRHAAWKKVREAEHVKEHEDANPEMIWVWRESYDKGVNAFLEARWQAFH